MKEVITPTITLGESVKNKVNRSLENSVRSPSYDSVYESVSVLISFSVCDSVEIIVEQSMIRL